MKEIYVLLTCTGTAFSRAIRYVTGSEFTHSSIALDINCSNMFSFARRQMFPPLPAGFVREDISTGILGKYAHCSCALYRIPVDRATYDRIAEELHQMEKIQEYYQYNCFGPFFCLFRIPYHSQAKFFCSEFVAEMLHKHGAIRLNRPSSLMRPNDFVFNEDLSLVYRGTLRGLTRRIRQNS